VTSTSSVEVKNEWSCTSAPSVYPHGTPSAARTALSVLHNVLSVGYDKQAAAWNVLTELVGGTAV
jgi:hypothetical protein